MITTTMLNAAWKHPTVLALKDCMQDLRWHPEGDAYTHTQQVTNRLVDSYADVEGELVWRKLGLAAILHDIGKVPTRVVQPDGTITHRGHGEVGAGMAWVVMGDLGIDPEDKPDVFWLIQNHMFTLHSALNAKDKTLKKYMSHPMWENLIRLGMADSRNGTKENVKTVLERAKDIRAQELRMSLELQ